MGEKNTGFPTIDKGKRGLNRGLNILEAQPLFEEIGLSDDTGTIDARQPFSEVAKAEVFKRWCEFRRPADRDQVIVAARPLVPPIARATARRFGYGRLQPRSNADGTRFDPSPLDELIAAGDLALILAVDSYRMEAGPFESYSRRSIKNACVRHGKWLRSVVSRPFDKPTPVDILIDPRLPPPRDVREPNCGARRAISVTDDDDVPPSGWTSLPAPPEPQIEPCDLKCLSATEARLVAHFLAGVTLTQTAAEMGISTTKAWRVKKMVFDKLEASA